MSKDTLKLNDREVLEYARGTLEPHLALEADGYTCTTADLFNVLVGGAAGRGTLESVCADLVGAPDADTVRGYLNEQLCVEDLPDLERGLNAALADEIPPGVWPQPRRVAIAPHDRPYYGKTPQAEGLWVRGRARDGTTRFYRVATAYVMLNGLRVTLAVHFVLPGETPVEWRPALRGPLKVLPVGVASLSLDRASGGGAGADYPPRHGPPALIA